MSQGNNVENLKLLFRDTERQLGGSHQRCRAGEVRRHRDNRSGACGGAGHGHRPRRQQQPSQPYRLRVTVHEDDNGQMTVYDLKYPDGGN